MCSRKRPGKSVALSLAVGAAVASIPQLARATISVTASGSNYIVNNGDLKVTFSPSGDDLTSIELDLSGGSNSPNLLNSSTSELDEEFAGTPFETNTAGTSSGIQQTANYVDMWTTVASGGPTNNPNPITYSFHYVMFNNDPNISCYEVLNHSSTDPATSVGQGQFLFRGNQTYFPNLYQVATGPNDLAPVTTLGVPSTNTNFSTATAQAGRTVQNVTYDLTGTGIPGDNGTNFFTKYDYSTYTQFFQAETMYGSSYAVSEVDPSIDTLTGGPTKQELAWTDPGILNMEFLSDHYGIDGSGSGAYPGYAYYPTQGVNTTKLFGPYTFQVEGVGTNSAAAINQQAINSIPTDQANFATDSELAANGYLNDSQRGEVQISATSPVGWSSNTVNNTVVLSEPGVNMQESTQGYEYWAQLASNGTVNITNAAPGTYRLTLYQLGQWGETRVDGVQVQAGQISIPKNLTFTPENFGSSPPIWTIGTPNRSSNEFMNGSNASGADQRQYYGAYDFWAEEQALGTPGYVSYQATTEPLQGITNTSTPSQWINNQWYTFDPPLYDPNNQTSDEYNYKAPAYVQAYTTTNAGGTVTYGPSVYHGAPWQVHFTVTPSQIAQGQYVVLSVGVVALDASLTISLNNKNSETWSYNNFSPDDPMIRSGDAAFYQWAAFQFPTSDLNAAGADDVFALSVSSHTDGVMYDALRMEITNNSASPASTGWYDYTYINGSDTAPIDSNALAAVNSFTPVPEPASLGLLGVAAMGFMPRRRRSRRLPTISY
ncbi:MAG: polysaccharide lyase family protein [Tepidisphaeraceae bacterium]|jgi:hypothetical protein